jgi:hypothetical protein
MTSGLMQPRYEEESTHMIQVQAPDKKAEVDLLTLASMLETEYAGEFHRTRVFNVGNFVFASLRAADGGHITIASYEPAKPMGHINAPRLSISTDEMAALDDFLGVTRTWYHFFTRGHSHKLFLAAEHLLTLVFKHNLASSSGNAIMALTKTKLVFSFVEIGFGDPETGSDDTTRNFYLVHQGELRSIMVKVSSPDPD